MESEPIIKEKKKRVMSEAQLANLKKGREAGLAKARAKKLEKEKKKKMDEELLAKAKEEGGADLALPLITPDQITGLLNTMDELKVASEEAVEPIEEMIVTAPSRLGPLTRALRLLFGEERTTEFWLNWMEEGELALGKMQSVLQLILGENLFENIKRGIEAAGIGDFMKTLTEGLVKGVDMFEDALVKSIEQGKLEFSDLGEHLRQVLAKALVQKFVTGPILAAFGLGGLAKGGPAAAGRPYIVGEEGPELFVPKVSGTVVPNDEMTSGGSGMGMGTTVNYNINAIDTRSFQQRLAENPEYIYNLTTVGARRQPA